VRILVLAVALGVLGVACQAPRDGATPSISTLKEGDAAPDFTLTSPSSEISLADYRGERAVLLYFSMGPG
jgi:hypothetical protein